jgi:hypothetical protein
MKSDWVIVGALLGLAMPSGANAAEWVPVSRADTPDQYFYDSSKLAIKGSEISYWKKVVFAAPRLLKGGEAASGLLRERIDCGEHTAVLISYLYYSAAGETLEYVAKHESEAAPIIPDTVGDAFERALCPKVWRKLEQERIQAEQKAAAADLAQQKHREAETAAAVAVPTEKPKPLPMPQIVPDLDGKVPAGDVIK